MHPFFLLIINPKSFLTLFPPLWFFTLL
jgi:hypothetical protein